MDKVTRRRRIEWLAGIKAAFLRGLSRIVSVTARVFGPILILAGMVFLAVRTSVWAVNSNLSDRTTAFLVFGIICLVTFPTPFLYRAMNRRLQKQAKVARDRHHEATVKRKRLERGLRNPELASSNQGLSFVSEAGDEGQLSLDERAASGALSSVEEVRSEE